MVFNKKWKGLLKSNHPSSQSSPQSSSQTSSQNPTHSSNQPPNQSSVPSLDHPRYYLVDEGVHDDNEPIYPGNFPFQDLIPGWVDLDPNTKNPRWEKRYTKDHYGAAKHGKKNSDLQKFRFGFCLEHCRDGDGTEYRYMKQFPTKSTQCKDHPRAQYKDGPNKIWKMMKDGRVANWGIINKVRREPADPASSAENSDIPPWDEIQAEADERAVTLGEDPQTAWDNAMVRYNQRRAIAKKTNKQTAREKGGTGFAPLAESSDLIARKSQPQKASGAVSAFPSSKAKTSARGGKKGTTGAPRWERYLAPLDEKTISD